MPRTAAVPQLLRLCINGYVHEAGTVGPGAAATSAANTAVYIDLDIADATVVNADGTINLQAA